MNSYNRIYTLLTEAKMSGASRAYIKQRRASTKHNVKARALDDKASAIEQKRNPDWASLGYLATTLRKKHSTHKRLGIELFAKALKNKKIIPQSVQRGVARMKARLGEGETTGGDMEATADRLGKWYKNIDTKAKPGKKGYMRKRNVPKPGEQYDPKRHAPQVKGKPLEYDSSRAHTKPQHGVYTRAHMADVITSIASKKAAPADVHRPNPAQTKKYKDLKKQGTDILRKSGWRGPMERKK